MSQDCSIQLNYQLVF